MKKKQFDFRKMSFYQIWVRSFCDGNGDGIGDLYGVYDKLDYIKSLGVDGIWFSPIFPSPNADYGYDISDYKNIHPDYGTLEQFQKVLDRAHELGLKVLLDLVIRIEGALDFRLGSRVEVGNVDGESEFGGCELVGYADSAVDRPPGGDR